MWCIHLGQGAHFIKNRIVRYKYHFMQKLTKTKDEVVTVYQINQRNENPMYSTTLVYSISEFLVCCCTCSNYTLCLAFSTVCQVSELGMEEGYVCTLLICFYPHITQNVGFLFADKYHFLFPNF